MTQQMQSSTASTGAPRGTGGGLLHLHLLDTSVASDNVGDEIITRYLRAQLEATFPDAYFTTSASHDGLGRFGRGLVEAADAVFLLGTNALYDRWRARGGLMPMSRADVRAMDGKLVLFGVGANRAWTGRADRRQVRRLSRLLSQRFTHSVRDSSAMKIVEAAGRCVLNGACPTIWTLPRQQSFAPARPEHVIFSLTAYRADRDADARFLDWLKTRYTRFSFWPQQVEDIAYFDSFANRPDATRIAPNLAAFDRALADPAALDVVGSRLHGGIHGLHAGRRSVILAVDNRAREIGAETQIPVLDRAEAPDRLDALLDALIEIDVTASHELATRYLSQFEELRAA